MLHHGFDLGSEDAGVRVALVGFPIGPDVGGTDTEGIMDSDIVGESGVIDLLKSGPMPSGENTRGDVEGDQAYGNRLAGFRVGVFVPMKTGLLFFGDFLPLAFDGDGAEGEFDFVIPDFLGDAFLIPQVVLHDVVESFAVVPDFFVGDSVAGSREWGEF